MNRFNLENKIQELDRQIKELDLLIDKIRNSTILQMLDERLEKQILRVNLMIELEGLKN